MMTYAQQTTAPQQPVPITNDTPAQTTRPETTPVPGSGAAVAPVSKSQLKAQRKQQKTEEKAANANAKAAKSQAQAKKQTDKAIQAQEKAAQPQ